MPTKIDIRRVSTDDDLEHARALFRAYADSIGFSLSFQGFEQELAELPGRYAPPSGCILLAHADGVIAGCVALRALQPGICEMKRLFVLPAFHARGIGRLLARAIIEEARRARYESMRLDTVPAMTPALALYASLGFRDIPAYTDNPIEGARFLELELGD